MKTDSATLCLVACFVILFRLTSAILPCNETQKLRKDLNKEDICCYTAKCNEGERFELCTYNGGTDTCSPCEGDYTTGMVIDTKFVNVQFNPCIQQQCPDGSVLMNKSCVCDTSRDFYGNDSSACISKTCQLGFKLTINGTCETCTSEDAIKSCVLPKRLSSSTHVTLEIVLPVVVVIAIIVGVFVLYRCKNRNHFTKTNNKLDVNVPPNRTPSISLNAIPYSNGYVYDEIDDYYLEKIINKEPVTPNRTQKEHFQYASPLPPRSLPYNEEDENLLQDENALNMVSSDDQFIILHTEPTNSFIEEFHEELNEEGSFFKWEPSDFSSTSQSGESNAEYNDESSFIETEDALIYADVQIGESECSSTSQLDMRMEHQGTHETHIILSNTVEAESQYFSKMFQTQLANLNEDADINIDRYNHEAITNYAEVEKSRKADHSFPKRRYSYENTTITQMNESATTERSDSCVINDKNGELMHQMEYGCFQKEEIVVEKKDCTRSYGKRSIPHNVEVEQSQNNDLTLPRKRHGYENTSIREIDEPAPRQVQNPSMKNERNTNLKDEPEKICLKTADTHNNGSIRNNVEVENSYDKERSFQKRRLGYENTIITDKAETATKQTQNASMANERNLLKDEHDKIGFERENRYTIGTYSIEDEHTNDTNRSPQKKRHGYENTSVAIDVITLQQDQASSTTKDGNKFLINEREEIFCESEKSTFRHDSGLIPNIVSSEMSNNKDCTFLQKRLSYETDEQKEMAHINQYRTDTNNSGSFLNNVDNKTIKHYEHPAGQGTTCNKQDTIIVAINATAAQESQITTEKQADLLVYPITEQHIHCCKDKLKESGAIPKRKLPNRTPAVCKEQMENNNSPKKHDTKRGHDIVAPVRKSVTNSLVTEKQEQTETDTSYKMRSTNARNVDEPRSYKLVLQKHSDVLSFNSHEFSTAKERTDCNFATEETMKITLHENTETNNLCKKPEAKRRHNVDVQTSKLVTSSFPVNTEKQQLTEVETSNRKCSPRAKKTVQPTTRKITRAMTEDRHLPANENQGLNRQIKETVDAPSVCFKTSLENDKYAIPDNSNKQEEPMEEILQIIRTQKENYYSLENENKRLKDQIQETDNMNRTLKEENLSLKKLYEESKKETMAMHEKIKELEKQLKGEMDKANTERKLKKDILQKAKNILNEEASPTSNNYHVKQSENTCQHTIEKPVYYDQQRHSEEVVEQFSEIMTK